MGLEISGQGYAKSTFGTIKRTFSDINKISPFVAPAADATPHKKITFSLELRTLTTN